MEKKKILTGMLALTLVFAMTVAGCDLFEKDDDSGNGNESGNNNGGVTGTADVYVAGNDSSDSVLWKNGVAQSLPFLNTPVAVKSIFVK